MSPRRILHFLLDITLYLLQTPMTRVCRGHSGCRKLSSGHMKVLIIQTWSPASLVDIHTSPTHCTQARPALKSSWLAWSQPQCVLSVLHKVPTTQFWWVLQAKRMSDDDQPICGSCRLSLSYAYVSRLSELAGHSTKTVWFSLTKTKTKMVKNEKITNSLTKTKNKTKNDEN